MSERSYYAAPAAGSAPTAIPCTIPAHRVLIEEDAVTQQGLIVTFAQDGFAQQYTYAAGVKVWIEGQGRDGVLSYGSGDYAKATSATATATHVRVTEYEV